VHGVRYHGVFAPHSRLRSRVVPEAHAPEPATRELPDAAAGDRPPDRAAPELDAKAAHERPPLRTYRVPWADLLKKVFALDVLACPECGGRLRLIAFIAEARVARKILDHLGLDSTGPPAAPARAQPDALEPAPDYDAADLVYEQ
jgi:hypothetical protein